jgi:hypothetical protein
MKKYANASNLESQPLSFVQQLGKNWKNLDFIFPRTRVSNADGWGRAALAR